jgi:hypothetical protein
MGGAGRERERERERERLSTDNLVIDTITTVFL